MNDAINFLTVSQQYLHTSEILLGKLYEEKNKNVVSTDDGSWESYEAQTKYSDFNIILPVLFTLYHGLELLMKDQLLKVKP